MHTRPEPYVPATEPLREPWSGRPGAESPTPSAPARLLPPAAGPADRPLLLVRAAWLLLLLGWILEDEEGYVSLTCILI